MSPRVWSTTCPAILGIFDLYCNYIVSVTLRVCFIEETCHLVAKSSGECDLQKSSAWFCSTLGEGWVCCGQGPWLWTPLVRGARAGSGRDRWWGSHIPWWKLKDKGTLKGVIKGRDKCRKLFHHQEWMNEWMLGQKPLKDIGWLGDQADAVQDPFSQGCW